MTDTLTLTKKLVSIPSYVGNDCNEKKIGEYIFEYLKDIKWLTVVTQKVETGRFNIIAYDKAPSKILICDHLDTVNPQSGWKTDPFEPVIKGGQLYGLGSSDSKGNLASILSAIKAASPTEGVMYLFYVDEEYNFAGMKKFIAGFSNKIKPQIIASGDGGNLEIGNSCRGLIEIKFTVAGTSGHSANPENGKNAITGTFESYQKLKSIIGRKSYKQLGRNTFNLAWIRGGQITGSGTIDSQGNIIPNYCELVIEIRVADTGLKASTVISCFEGLLKKRGLKLTDTIVTHDLGAWLTEKVILKDLPLETKIFTPAVKRGYVDLQMLWEKFNKPVSFTFGAGEPGTAHNANEYVKIEKLNIANQFWMKLIQKYAI
jgi:acetylornithine deacetylase/succinyl-diaminopimelate desuccinylase-like protein